MIRKLVNYVLTLMFALVPTVWLFLQIHNDAVSWWLVILWMVVMAFCIAVTYGKEPTA
jgi:hypothetical protein